MSFYKAAEIGVQRFGQPLDELLADAVVLAKKSGYEVWVEPSRRLFKVVAADGFLSSRELDLNRSELEEAVRKLQALREKQGGAKSMKEGVYKRLENKGERELEQILNPAQAAQLYELMEIAVKMNNRIISAPFAKLGTFVYVRSANFCRMGNVYDITQKQDETGWLFDLPRELDMLKRFVRHDRELARVATEMTNPSST